MCYKLVPMARISLIPQKREFFDLYNNAAANAVSISERLIELLDEFPNGADDHMRDIKELEHAGDRITHDLIDLINRTFVTPFDRDDMFRLAGVLDDICDNVDDTAEKIVGYGVQEVRGEAREQANGRQPRGEEARRGDQPARGLQGFETAADRAARARGRGRPPCARCHLGSLQRGRRCDHAHPLEGHPRAARGSSRRV